MYIVLFYPTECRFNEILKYYEEIMTPKGMEFVPANIIYTVPVKLSVQRYNTLSVIHTFKRWTQNVYSV